MSNENLTTLAAILKNMYPNDVDTACYKNHPFLSMLKKNTNFLGDYLIVPVGTAGPSSRSANAAYAFANHGTHASYKFQVTRAKDYVGMAIEREAVMAGRGEGAIKDTLQWTVDLGMMKIGNSLASALFRSGGGAVARLTASIASSTVTLKNPEDIVNFEVGDKFQLSDTDGGTLRSTGATATITSVNRDAGTFGISGHVTGSIAAAADNDYIIIYGDNQAKLKGLAGWLPTTAPTNGDSFYGVDRSVDPTRLAGCRIDASSYSGLEEAFIRGIGRVGREGGNPDVIVTNPKHWQDLAVELGDKARFSTSEATGGFEYLTMAGPTGVCKVVGDRFCEAGKAYILTMNTWELASAGKAPTMFDGTNGKPMLEWLASADAYELRGGYYGALVCRAPWSNGVLFNL